MIIECINGSLTKEEQLEIQNHASKFEIEFDNREHVIINAALDELVGQVVVWLSSKEVTAIVNSIEIANAFFKIVNNIKKFTSERRITKLDTKLAIQQSINVIIQIDNILIIQPEPDIPVNQYLIDALTFVDKNSIPKKVEIIISYDNRLRIETIDQYARRKMKM